MLTASGDLADSLVESDGAGNITANVTGSATTLATSRNFSITGDITAAAIGFNGSGNVALNASIDSGVVGEAEIATGAVHTAELQTAVQQSASSTGVALTVTYTGGSYTFLAGITSSNTGAGAFQTYRSTGSYSYACEIGAVSGAVVRFTARYVQSSPPYDMGDGEIPLYVFALVDKNGKIVATDIARDPLWAANGPTLARGKTAKDGKTYKKEIILPENYESLHPMEKAAARREAKFAEVEVTQEIKHADMHLLPHPWTGMDLKALGLTPVLLDPVSDCVSDIAELYEVEDDVCNILLDDYIKVGNTCLSRCGPQGLLIPEATWK